MSLGPTFPLPFGLTGLGIIFNSVKLASGVPGSDYTVIVPVHNKEDSIKSVLRAIKHQTKRAEEIIVVNDGSTDGTQEILEEIAERKEIRYIDLVQNVGKSRAINLALNMVKTPYVLIVDADTYLSSGFAHNAMLGFYSRDVVGVCGRVLSSQVFSSVQKSRFVEYLYGQRIYKPLQARYKGLWVLAGCATMWRTWWLLENSFPENSVVEDLEATWEAQKNYLVNYNPDAVCFTEDPKTLKTYTKQIARWFSWRPSLRKHYKEVSKGLKFTILWTIGESFGFLLYLGIMLYLLSTFQWPLLLLMLGIDMLILSTVTYAEARKILMVKRAMLGIPRYFLMRYFNAFLFFKALIKPSRRWEPMHEPKGVAKTCY